MFLSTSPYALSGPSLALAASNGNGADFLSIYTQKFLNLASNLEEALNLGETPETYIEANQSQFNDLDRLDAFREEYATLSGIFRGQVVADPPILESILRNVIANIHETSQKILTPAEYERCVGGERSPTPPPVAPSTEASPPPSHFTGPPTTPTEDVETEATKQYEIPPDFSYDPTRETTARMTGPATLKDPPRRSATTTLRDVGVDNDDVDTFAGLDGVETPESPQVAVNPLLSDETLQALNQMAITKRSEGDYEGAIKLCRDGIAYAGKQQNKLAFHMFQITLAETWRQFGQSTQSTEPAKSALILLKGALEYLDQHPDPFLLTQVHPYLSMTYSDLSQWDRAMEHGILALNAANQRQILRTVAVSHLSMALACLGSGDSAEALAASQKSMEALEKYSGRDEYDLKIRMTHAICLRQNADWAAAAQMIDQTHLAMRQRAQQLFPEEWKRKRFLSQVATHRQIEAGWLSLRDYLGYDTDEQIRLLLSQMNLRPRARRGELTEFIDSQVHSVTIKPAIVQEKYPLLNHIAVKEDEAQGLVMAGAIVDRALEEVVRAFVSKPLGVAENKGKVPGVSARDISLMSFVDRDQKLYVHARWKMRAIAGMHKTGLLHTFGVKDSYEHLLVGSLSKLDGGLMITLDAASEERVFLAAQKKVEVPFERRPKPADGDKPAEFGRLGFYFQPLDNGRTAVAAIFQKARFTDHPEVFVAAGIRNLALAG